MRVPDYRRSVGRCARQYERQSPRDGLQDSRVLLEEFLHKDGCEVIVYSAPRRDDAATRDAAGCEK